MILLSSMARSSFRANAAGSGDSGSSGGSSSSGMQAVAAARPMAQVARKPAQCHARANAHRLRLMTYLFGIFTRHDR